MPVLGESIRLVELICARLCHDIGGLIGTVSNAVEMVAEDATADDEVLAFASSASKALTQRLRLLRAAWGPDSHAMELSALVRMVTAPLAIRRIDVDTSSIPPDAVFSGPVGRVILNLIVLACDCLPKGGTIALMGDPSDVLIRIVGPDAAWPAGFTACMRDEAAAFDALTGPQAVQMPLTVLLALSRNLRLSPVLGPRSGLEAVRLGPA
jgi:histidine phosphotransferase ChpT